MAIEGQRRLGRTGCRWEDDIELIFEKYGGDMGWIQLARS
jgi:hypothetical protein